jgi:hypothetical protein
MNIHDTVAIRERIGLSTQLRNYGRPGWRITIRPTGLRVSTLRGVMDVYRGAPWTEMEIDRDQAGTLDQGSGGVASRPTANVSVWISNFGGPPVVAAARCENLPRINPLPSSGRTGDNHRARL